MAAMVTLSDITSVHWQLALNNAGVAEGEADIHQSIRIILGTPKGSVPHRPDFGSDIRDYIDYPILEAIPHVVREAADAVAKWEPRCTLLKVTPIVNQEQLSVRVKWRLADGVERQTDSMVRG